MSFGEQTGLVKDKLYQVCHEMGIIFRDDDAALCLFNKEPNDLNKWTVVSIPYATHGRSAQALEHFLYCLREDDERNAKAS